MTPIEQAQQRIAALERRIESLEKTVETKLEFPLLPAELAAIASDMQIMIGICRNLSVSHHWAPHRPKICKELKGRGWNVARISRVLGIGQDRVRRHLKRPDSPVAGTE